MKLCPLARHIWSTFNDELHAILMSGASNWTSLYSRCGQTRATYYVFAPYKGRTAKHWCSTDLHRQWCWQLLCLGWAPRSHLYCSVLSWTPPPLQDCLCHPRLSHSHTAVAQFVRRWKSPGQRCSHWGLQSGWNSSHKYTLTVDTTGKQLFTCCQP